MRAFDRPNHLCKLRLSSAYLEDRADQVMQSDPTRGALRSSGFDQSKDVIVQIELYSLREAPHPLQYRAARSWVIGIGCGSFGHVRVGHARLFRVHLPLAAQPRASRSGIRRLPGAVRPAWSGLRHSRATASSEGGRPGFQAPDCLAQRNRLTKGGFDEFQRKL